MASNDGTLHVRAGVTRLDAFNSKCDSLGTEPPDMVRSIMDALISGRLTIKLTPKESAQLENINEVFVK